MDPHTPLPAAGKASPDTFRGQGGEARTLSSPVPESSTIPALAQHGQRVPPAKSKQPAGNGGSQIPSELTDPWIWWISEAKQPSSGHRSKGGGSSLLPLPCLATASGDPAPACAGTAPGGSRPPAACKLGQGSVGFQRGRHAPRRGSPNTHGWARRGLPSREWPQSLPLPPLLPASPAFPSPEQSSRMGQCPQGWDNSAPAPKSQE